jgi:ribosomal protein S27E
MPQETSFFPEHLEGYVQDATQEFPEDSGAFHHYYKLVCSCGSQHFQLRKSNRESIRASCQQCGHEIVVYDLSYYPAACKVAGDEHFELLTLTSGTVENHTVFLMFEYGEFDDDQDFDRNDISWCQVFLKDASGRHACVFDDETA